MTAAVSTSQELQHAPGVFISFEGADGVGKSTQIGFLATRLQDAGYEVLCLREPGGTKVGEAVRQILLDPGNSEMTPGCELLLYEAARAQLVEQTILPALKQGCIVLCDRFSDSTTAYQGFGRGMDLQTIKQANMLGSQGCTPDRTIIIIRDAGEAFSKATESGADRLEAEGLDFQQRVHQGFAALAAAEPGRVRLVQMQDSKEATAQAIYQQLEDLFQ
jgi:dTMP kinase